MELEKIYKKVYKEKINVGLNIFFGDAKQSWERGMSIFSALFWTWLEFSFLRFFFIFIFGIAGYVGSGDFTYTWDLMLRNTKFVDLFIKIFFILIFITRIKIFHVKEVKR